MPNLISGPSIYQTIVNISPILLSMGFVGNLEFNNALNGLVRKVCGLSEI